MEIRGKVGEEGKVRNWCKENKGGKGGKERKEIGGYDGCLGPLLWLNLKEKIVIRPFGISEILVRSSIKKYNIENNQKPKQNIKVDDKSDNNNSNSNK